MNLPAHLQLDVDGRYVDTLHNPHVPSYVSFDVRVAWWWKDKLEISIVGQNLWDDQHPEFGAVATREEIPRSVFGKVAVVVLDRMKPGEPNIDSRGSIPGSHRASWRRIALRSAGLWAIALLLCTGSAADQVAREYQLKAVFLYNFAQFTEWPADAFADEKSPIVIGIVGTDPFGATLEDTIRAKP